MSTDWKALCEELAREVELYALDRGDEIPDCVDRACAALAEPVGEQPAPSAAGEVGELVALIRQISLAWEPDACLLGNMTAGQLTRAADLLESQAAPVPVAERPWERDGWCDEQGRCWFGWHRPMHILNPAMWMLCSPDVRDILFHQACLPATALPLPQGEVQP